MSTFVILNTTSTLIPVQGIIAAAVSLTVEKSLDLQTDLSAIPLAVEKTSVNADYVIELTQDVYESLAALGVDGLEIVEEEVEEEEDAAEVEEEDEEEVKPAPRSRRRKQEPEPEPEVIEPNLRYYLRQPLSDTFNVVSAPVAVHETDAYLALDEEAQDRVNKSLSKLGELIATYTASPEVAADDDDDFPISRTMIAASLTASVQATQESREELRAKIEKRVFNMAKFLSPEEEPVSCTMDTLGDVLTIDEDAMADLVSRIRSSAEDVFARLI